MHFHLKWKSAHYLVIYALMTHPEDLYTGYEKWFAALKVIFLPKSSIIVNLKLSESQQLLALFVFTWTTFAYSWLVWDM